MRRTLSWIASALSILTLTAAAGGERIAVRPFGLNDIRLLAGPALDARERTRRYLTELESDRLLHTFRLNAGLPSSALPLGGWEEPSVELRGHFLGHYLTACAEMFAGTGDTVLKAKGDSIVAALGRVQEKLGNGFLSAYPESFLDRVETGRGVWAPWYTLHKIMAGLLDMHVLTGNTEALRILTRFVAWAKARTDRLDEEAMQRMLRVEFGGMNDVLRRLYAVTRDPAHLALARRFDHAAVLAPLAAQEDRLTGLHANTQIPKILGAAMEYELTGSLRDHAIATYFWEEVEKARTYVCGGTSYEELWGMEPYHLATHLGQFDHETCCTYNMMKLTAHLFGWEPRARYADYYERALLNGIMSVQNPADGMTMYYVPMGRGWFKTFGTKRESFWCCTGTGVELFSTLQSNAYFHDSDNLYVVLFLPTEVTWKERGIRLRQETAFPDQQGTSITIRTGRPQEFSVHLRIPEWTGKGGSVSINGKRLDVFAAPGSFLELRRLWKDGDRLELSLPMQLRLERMPDNPNRCALLYGPVVLAGELGSSGMTDSTVSGPYGPEGDPLPVPFFVAPARSLESWIIPVAGTPLTFRTVGAGRNRDVTLSPFFRLFGQRYAIYWDLYEPGEWEGMTKLAAARGAGVVDSVALGEGSEREHDLQGFRLLRGEQGGKKWLACGDWFKIDLTVPAGREAALFLTTLSGDSGTPFGVTVDGRKIGKPFTQSERGGGLQESGYRLPPEMTAGKKKVGVIFRVNRGEKSQKLFGCQVIAQ